MYAKSFTFCTCPCSQLEQKKYVFFIKNVIFIFPSKKLPQKCRVTS